eukprot:SAG11_NODE_34417_length_272_cov_0.595376_1_plen_37_part_10
MQPRSLCALALIATLGSCHAAPKVFGLGPGRTGTESL